jgi:ribonuclease inhibitor
MRYAVIDGGTISDRAELHRQLARVLELPDWYGANLDALYDCLTDCFEGTELHLTHFDALEGCLGDYAGKLEAVLRRAAGDNPRLRIALERG